MKPAKTFLRSFCQVRGFQNEVELRRMNQVFTFLWKMKWLIDYPCINSWSLFSRSFPPILPSFACPFLFPLFFLLLGKFSYRTSKIDCTSLCREYWLSCFVGKILSRRCYRRYDDILENEISVIRKYMIRKFVSSIVLSNFANGYNFTTIACNLCRDNYSKYQIWNQF